MSVNELPPGIHYGIPFAQYRELPGINISRLEWGQFSAEHMRAALDGKLDRDSEAMTLGRAIHARLLEPDVYRERFRIALHCEAVLKSGDRKGRQCGNSSAYYVDGQWLCGTHGRGNEPVADVISQEDADRVGAIAEKVKGHKVIRLLRQRGGYEATIVWEMEGELCKGRLDKLIPRSEKLPSVVVDLKKCRLGHAKLDLFEKAILNYNYDMKAAWYVDGVAALTGDPPGFVWIAVEDEYPYGVNVVQADRETLLVGRIRYRELLGKYLRSKSSGEWDGYTKDIVSGGLPDWAKIQYLGGM